MELARAIVPTPLVRAGTTVGEALRLCVDIGVPGLPFADARDRVSGRFSVRHTLLASCIPSDMVSGAHLIGHEALHLEHPPGHYGALFARTIDSLILPAHHGLGSGAQITKALALMEKLGTGYLFVVDDGRYRGIVTRLGLARVLLEAAT